MFLTYLEANGIHFGILAGVSKHSISSKNSTNPADKKKAAFTISPSVGYRWITESSNVCIDWNFINFTYSSIATDTQTQLYLDASITEFRIGKIFKNKFAIYGIINPFNIVVLGDAKDTANPNYPVGKIAGGVSFTFGAGASYKVLSVLSICAQYTFGISYGGLGVDSSSSTSSSSRKIDANGRILSSSSSFNQVVQSIGKSIYSHKFLAGIDLHTSKFYG